MFPLDPYIALRSLQSYEELDTFCTEFENSKLELLNDRYFDLDTYHNDALVLFEGYFIRKFRSKLNTYDLQEEFNKIRITSVR